MKKALKATNPGVARRSVAPLRFAHPFFTTTPVEQRKPVPGVGTSLMNHIQGNLETVPAPKRTPVMTLADIIGAQASQEIQASGSIRFHSVGDTGKSANSPQGDVAAAMATDYDVSKPQPASPAFFFHLGDVIYGPGKDNAYRGEFYEPTCTIRARSLRSPATMTARSSPRQIPRR